MRAFGFNWKKPASKRYKGFATLPPKERGIIYTTFGILVIVSFKATHKPQRSAAFDIIVQLSDFDVCKTSDLEP